MKTIKEIPSIDTFAVRHPVLRPGKPIESCRFEGDNEFTTKHFGVFVDENLAGIASLFETPSDLFDGKQFQLRGMAVLENHQRKGLGQDLVCYAEHYAEGQNTDIIWFNARIVAVPFYEKLGYETVGDSFNISDVGQHFVMFKRFR